MIPTSVTSAASADVALREFLAWTKPEMDEVLPGYLTYRGAWLALARVEELRAELAREPGPGPCVEAHMPGDAPRLLGRPLPSEGRTSIRITEPVGGEYGLSITDPVQQLAEQTANVRTIRLLAARCGTCAAADRDRPGRTRQAERLEAEAEALTNYASDLERHIEPLGGRFLGVWRDEVNRRAPEPTRHPLTRSVELRQNP